MSNTLDTQINARRQKVLEGIHIILSLFSITNQQRIFPRKIMTKNTRGQTKVYSKEQMIQAFEYSDFVDCRINAYPSFLNEAEERDYLNDINLNIFAPNILFIDLDQKDFSSKAEMDKSLNKILKHISKILYGSKPLLLWSGNGYHIIIPVKSTEALEQFEDFKGLTERPSNEFLQFAKEYLSFSKVDKANNPAFKSCLLRVPYSFNSKCIVESRDPEVKIIHEFDTSKPLPEIDNLLVEFITFLADRKLKESAELEKKNFMKETLKSNNVSSSTVQYIEKLLEIGISDYRKNAVGLILAPYFVNILKLSDEESFNRIKEWILKCNNVKPLEPSIKDFDNSIKNAITRAKVIRIKPLKFRETLQYKNKKLYHIILSYLKN